MKAGVINGIDFDKRIEEDKARLLSKIDSDFDTYRHHQYFIQTGVYLINKSPSEDMTNYFKFVQRIQEALFDSMGIPKQVIIHD